MGDVEAVVLNFKIGTLKELYKRRLVTCEELDKAVKIIKGNTMQPPTGTKNNNTPNF